MKCQWNSKDHLFGEKSALQGKLKAIDKQEEQEQRNLQAAEVRHNLFPVSDETSYEKGATIVNHLVELHKLRIFLRFF